MCYFRAVFRRHRKRNSAAYRRTFARRRCGVFAFRTVVRGKDFRQMAPGYGTDGFRFSYAREGKVSCRFCVPAPFFPANPRKPPWKCRPHRMSAPHEAYLRATYPAKRAFPRHPRNTFSRVRKRGSPYSPTAAPFPRGLRPHCAPKKPFRAHRAS